MEEVKRYTYDVLPEALSLTIDFDDASVRESSRALLRLRRTARFSSRPDFRHFDLAYALFFAKRNPDFTFEKKKLPYLEEAGVVGDIVGAFDGLGIIGAFKGIAEQLHRLAERLGLTDEARDELLRLRECSEREAEEALPDFLAYDCHRANKRHAAPVIVFLDTYEVQWSVNTTEAELFTKDAWVRRLAAALPGALFVVSGRERLRWDECDSVWRGYLVQHCLDRLSPIDSRLLLFSAGLKDTNLVERMVTTSEGHPYYLDLCIDICHELRADEREHPQPADWPEQKRSLFDRFVRSIPPAELDLLKCIAARQTYDLHYAIAVARVFGIPLSDMQIEAHTRFSFVKEEQGRLAIHEIMRRALLAHTPPHQVVAIRRFVITYCSDILANAARHTPDMTLLSALRECVEQFKALRDTNAISDWLNSSARSALNHIQERGASSALTEVFADLNSFHPLSNWPVDARLVFMDMVHLQGRYREAVHLLSREFQAAEDALSNQQKCFAWVRAFHHRMMVEPIGQIWTEIESRMPAILQLGDPLVVFEASYLLGGNLGVIRGRYSQAHRWLLKAIAIARATSRPDMMCRVLRRVSDFFALFGQYKRATAIAERGIAIAEEHNLRRYRLYLQCSAADALRMQQHYADALELIKLARLGFAECGIEGWLGHTHLAEAAVHIDCSRVDIAERAVAEASRYYLRTDHAWGLLNCEILNCQILQSKGVAWSTCSESLGRAIGRAEELGYEHQCARLKSALMTRTLGSHPIGFL